VTVRASVSPRGGGAIGRVHRRLARRLSRSGVTLTPSLQRRLAAALGATALATCGYLFWFRDSSLVGVERVAVSGLTTRDAGRVRDALSAAARGMTTLHVRTEELEDAVSGYPVVRSVRASADFPHTLRIRVIEHRAVARVSAAGAGPIPVAADGTVLRGLPMEGRLPLVRATDALPGRRVSDPRTLRLLRVAGTAPAPLANRLDRVSERRGRGIFVRLRRGTVLLFGDASRLRAKWAAAARVLADASARGATYVDLRLPERPAAGGLLAQPALPEPTGPPASAPLLAPPAPPPGGSPSVVGRAAPPGPPPDAAPGTAAAPQQRSPEPQPAPRATGGGGATAP
jgi:cell division protein FtsQ